MRNTMRKFFRYAKENALSMSQMGALMQLHHKGVCGVSDIGDDLGISSAAASQMLERLFQQGLIERSEDPHDRRVKQIILTDKGLQVLQAGFQARQSWLDDLARSLTPAEREQVLNAFSLLIEKAKQLDETTHKCETDNTIMNHES